MVNSVSNVSSIQLSRAIQAFKSSVKSAIELEQPRVDEKAVEAILSPESINAAKTTTVSKAVMPDKNSGYINDVMRFAAQNGREDITEDDIQYALRFGRSILVNQVG